MKNFLLICSLFLVLTQNGYAALSTKYIKKTATDDMQAQIATVGFADIVETILPAVVNISAVQDAKNTDEKFVADAAAPKEQKTISSIGSGFIVSQDGYIITNNHVVEDSGNILISLNDGSKYKAKIVGLDKKTELALIKIDSDRVFPSVKFGDSNKARIGDWVIAIGNPYGLGGSVSAGIISARSRSINNDYGSDFLQVDAAINKGNSGGPIFNVKGEVIGVSTALFSPSGNNIGIGFAIPSTTVATVAKQLKEYGEVTRGWIGISVQNVTPEMAKALGASKIKGGAFVTDVTNDGPADRAGIQASDIILKFDDKEITEMKLLPQYVSSAPLNQEIPVTVLRGGKIRVLTIKVAKTPNETK